MERILLARHAESELSAQEVVNGEPQTACGLTPHGEEQAVALRGTLAAEPIDLAVTSDFDRCRQTVKIALGGRAVSRLELPELGDIRCGVYEGRRIADYRSWAHDATASTHAPGGGESRVAAARRFAAGIRLLLCRPEATALVVSHQLVVAYLLTASRGELPRPRVETIPPATPFDLTAFELEHAARTLEAWAARPDW